MASLLWGSPGLGGCYGSELSPSACVWQLCSVTPGSRHAGVVDSGASILAFCQCVENEVLVDSRLMLAQAWSSFPGISAKCGVWVCVLGGRTAGHPGSVTQQA